MKPTALLLSLPLILLCAQKSLLAAENSNGEANRSGLQCQFGLSNYDQDDPALIPGIGVQVAFRDGTHTLADHGLFIRGTDDMADATEVTVQTSPAKQGELFDF